MGSQHVLLQIGTEVEWGYSATKELAVWVNLIEALLMLEILKYAK